MYNILSFNVARFQFATPFYNKCNWFWRQIIVITSFIVKSSIYSVLIGKWLIFDYT